MAFALVVIPQKKWSAITTSSLSRMCLAVFLVVLMSEGEETVLQHVRAFYASEKR
jgi:hypothetical protein